jgi:hypothetical protein
MDPLIVVFLGIIAFCALVNAVVLTVAAVVGWKAAARLDTLAERAESEIGRLGQKVEQLTARVETLARQAHETMARTEPAVDRAAARTERAGSAIRRAVETPGAALRNGGALLHGVMRAIDAYRYLRRPAAR